MKKIVLLSAFLFASYSFSQEKIEFIDIEEVTNIVTKASQEGDFEKSLEALNKISKNDSSYCSVLTSKSYYLLQLEEYNKVVDIADFGLESDCVGYGEYFYINKVVALMSLEKYEEAIDVTNEGLKTFPYSHKLLFNKASSLENLDRIEEAIIAYQKTILVNPLYKRPHLQLGNICYKQQKMAQALMCFNMYLLLDPDGEGSFETLKSLNNTVSKTNDNVPNPDLKISDDDQTFDEIDLILNQKVAINEAYKTGNKINVALVKQNHALLQQLKDFSGNGGFWYKKYVPFYNWITNNNLFNNFTYTLLHSIENEEYSKVIEKNSDEISSFYNSYRDKWKEIVSKNEEVINGKKEEVSYYFNDGYIQGVGKLKNEKTIGQWNFYNENGGQRSKGGFADKGERNGKWTWYYPSGQVKEVANYVEGKLDGKGQYYHENGRINVDYNYEKDSLNGEYKLYNNKGALMHKKYYKNGKLDGIYESYFDIGDELLEFHIPYSNGLIDGKLIEYYANGDVFSEINYKKGKKEGLTKKYYIGNKLNSESNYVNDQLQGEYKIYFRNGNLMEEGQSVDGRYSGSFKRYYRDKTVESEFNYNNGKLDGLYKFYDIDGKIYYEYSYRKEEIISYKFFDKQGNIIKEGNKKGGEFIYNGYSTSGNLTSEGLYDISGGKTGKWKFYNSNGFLTEEGNYIENKVEGENKTYHKNGKIKSISNYKNDVLDGYYVDYYINGQINSQGWYKDGKQHGEWRYYFIDGTLKAKDFYHKGEFNGEQELYACNGVLSRVYKYNFGDFNTDILFDMDGKEFQILNFEQDKKEYVINYKYFNGSIDASIKYKNGVKHGDYAGFNFDGTKKTTGSYLNNNMHGEWIWYYDTGQVESKRNYINGKLDGEALNYYKNGAIEDKYIYRDGSVWETSLSYYEDGTIKTSTQFKNDLAHGRKEFYSPSGKLQLIRFYSQGRLMGYSYLGKNSKEVSMIPVLKETGVAKAYFDNGNVSREMEYINGELVNTYKAHYYSGELEQEVFYTDGENNGLNTEYFKNGKIKKQTEYLFGNKHGKDKEYYENGKLKKETSYLNDIENGESNHYNENGKLIKKEEYFNGDVYSLKTY